MDNVEKEKLEQNRSVVEMWIWKISDEGVVGEIDPQMLRSVLESYGANFEISEAAKESLGWYSNYYKRPGLDAVWGKPRVDAYKKWVKEVFIPGYEKKTGRELHTLWDPKTETYDDIKHSGMMQFLGELTAFAGGFLSKEKYKFFTEDRVKKGQKFAYGDPYEPYKPSPHSPVPPEFPLEAWKIIKTPMAEQ